MPNLCIQYLVIVILCTYIEIRQNGLKCDMTPGSLEERVSVTLAGYQGKPIPMILVDRAETILRITYLFALLIFSSLNIRS